MLTRLGGLALEPLLGAGSGDDVLAVAEPQKRLQSALLGPQGVELLGDLLQLRSKGGIVALAQLVVDLDAAFARPVDVAVNVLERSHARKNAGHRPCIPALAAEEKQDQNGSTNGRGHDRDHVQERGHA